MNRPNLRLIPEFNGSPMCPSVVKVKEPAMIMPLRLLKGAYAMYQQLGDEADQEEKACPVCSLGNRLISWLEMIHWTTAQSRWNGWRIPSWFKTIISIFWQHKWSHHGTRAFLAGLPEGISQLLQTSSKLNELGIDQLLAWAQCILKDNVLKPQGNSKCYRCSGPNHFLRNCQSRSNTVEQLIKEQGDDRVVISVWTGPYIMKLFGKWVQGQGIVATVDPSRSSTAA